MILTCPSCQKRFAVPESALKPAGRKVRCSSCRHVWFQAPESGVDEAPSAVEAAAEAAVDQTPVIPEPEKPEADEPQQPSDVPEEAAVAADDDGAARDDASDASRDEDDDVGGSGGDSIAMPWPSPDDMARQPEQEFDIARVVGPEQQHGRERQRGRGGVWVWLTLIVLIAAVVVALHEWRNHVMRLFPQSIEAYVAAGLIAPPSSSGLRLDDVAFDMVEDGDDRILVVTGQVVNEGGEVKQLPMLRGELLDADGQVVAFWEFSTPYRVLGPGERTVFRDAYANPPVSGSETDLFVTFADLR